jgi:hypothetical protein
MWELIAYEMPEAWGDIVPVMFIARLDDFVACMALNSQFTTAMRAVEFASNYILLCVANNS